MTDKVKHHHKPHVSKPQTKPLRLDTPENELARPSESKPTRRYSKGDGITTEKPQLPSADNPNPLMRGQTKPARLDGATKPVPKPKPGYVDAKPMPKPLQDIHAVPKPKPLYKPAVDGAAGTGEGATKPAISSTQSASTAAVADLPGASEIHTASAASTASSTQPVTAAKKPEEVYTPEELKALEGFDLQDAMMLGIHPKICTVWQTVDTIHINQQPPEGFSSDSDGGVHPQDPEMGRTFRKNSSDDDGMVTVCQKKVTQLMVTPADAERLEKMAEIPKDLTWDSMVKKYGHEFETLSPAVKEAVAKDPRRAIAGLTNLTNPNYGTRRGTEITHGEDGPTEIPDLVMITEPDRPELHLPKDQVIVGRNPANGTLLSVGCEGGWASTGKPGADLAYMNWDPEYGLTAPASAYIEIRDKPDPIFGAVVGLMVTVATGGIAGPIVAGALGGAASAAVNGGNILQGALMGGVTGGMGGVSGAISSTVSEAVGGGLAGQVVGEAVGHAATGAVTAAVSGGDIARGALQGAVSGGLGAAAPAISGAVGGGTVGDVVGGAVTGAVGAAVSGGDVVRGALGGAASGASGAISNAVSNAVGGGDLGRAIGGAVSGAVTAAVSGGDVAGAALNGFVSGVIRNSPSQASADAADGDEKPQFDFQGTGIGDGEPINGTLYFGDDELMVQDGNVWDGTDYVGTIDAQGNVNVALGDSVDVDTDDNIDGDDDVDPTEEMGPPAPVLHTVAKGESLSKIAERELGDANRWPEIYALNRDAIGDNPNALKAGATLQMPPEDFELSREERNALFNQAYIPPKPDGTPGDAPVVAGGPDDTDRPTDPAVIAGQEDPTIGDRALRGEMQQAVDAARDREPNEALKKAAERIEKVAKALENPEKAEKLEHMAEALRNKDMPTFARLFDDDSTIMKLAEAAHLTDPKALTVFRELGKIMNVVGAGAAALGAAADNEHTTTAGQVANIAGQAMADLLAGNANPVVAAIDGALGLLKPVAEPYGIDLERAQIGKNLGGGIQSTIALVEAMASDDPATALAWIADKNASGKNGWIIQQMSRLGSAGSIYINDAIDNEKMKYHAFVNAVSTVGRAMKGIVGGGG